MWGCCGCYTSIYGVVVINGLLYSRFYGTETRKVCEASRNLGHAPPGNFEIHML